MKQYDELIERFTAWAEGEDNVRAAVVIGSRARMADHPADDWSDLDLLVFCRDPKAIWQETDWLDTLGDVWTSFLEPASDGGLFERRALLAPGLDVDIVPLSAAALEEKLERGFPPYVADIIHRGYRLLVDKGGCEGRLQRLLPPAPAWRAPEPVEFLNLVHDFWFHTVWTAKKLRRGELWQGKYCCDVYLKDLLRRAAEWHAGLTAGVDTWMEGRFLDEWIDPRARAALSGAFARYDEADVWRALEATGTLFDWLSRETAEKLGIPYPDRAARETSELVRKLYEERPAR